MLSLVVCISLSSWWGLTAAQNHMLHWQITWWSFGWLITFTYLPRQPSVFFPSLIIMHITQLSPVMQWGWSCTVNNFWCIFFLWWVFSGLWSTLSSWHYFRCHAPHLHLNQVKLICMSECVKTNSQNILTLKLNVRFMYVPKNELHYSLLNLVYDFVYF